MLSDRAVAALLSGLAGECAPVLLLPPALMPAVPAAPPVLLATPPWAEPVVDVTAAAPAVDELVSFVAPVELLLVLVLLLGNTSALTSILRTPLTQDA
jgi:hypothetical protein